MKEKESALFSRYVIDGIQCDATPHDMLEECMTEFAMEIPEENELDDIVDESTDPPLTSFTYSNDKNEEYINQITDYQGIRPFRMLYPDSFTKQRIAFALLDRLWTKGHYRLGDLRLWVEWKWNSKPLGNMAAFYQSVKACTEYIYDLGCRLEDFSYDGCDEESSFCAGAWLAEEESTDETTIHEDSILIKTSPYESRHPWIEDVRQCPEHIVADSDSQLIYIPFETAAFKLGGSLLAELNGHNGGTAPVIQDPDYFIDCYEVVRELVEDGIIIAGTTVGDGGLARALSSMCQDYGISLNIKGISSSYMEDDSTRILFSEIPGVIIQVAENNMDYIDSQFLLQDVAYYILGKADSNVCGLKLETQAEITVAGILASLINQVTEGED